jgi:hypothetical protein
MNINEIKIEDNSKYLKLVEGENQFRIVSGFVVREVTYKSGQVGTKYTCFVIDRKDGKIKFADFGASIIKQIQSLAGSREYGFDSVPKYDMFITREGTGQFDTKYVLRAARQDSELTAEEAQLVMALPPIEKAFGRDGEINVDEIPF